MALLEDEPPVTARRLLLVGLPSFVAATAFSLITHWQAHRVGAAAFCPELPAGIPAMFLSGADPAAGPCGMSALSGQLWTFGLALISFGLFLRYPRNLFLMSMAFVNATARLPEALTIFVQYLVHNRTVLQVDEAASLALIGPSDPAIPMIIMCAYSLLLLFFSIIVVHDVKVVRFKWPVAVALFAAAGFLETGLLRLMMMET